MEAHSLYQTRNQQDEKKKGIRRFLLVRDRDPSGVSGTGIVAEGVLFSNGLSVLHWLREPQALGMYQSLPDLMSIHGHAGATQIHFIDQE